MQQHALAIWIKKNTRQSAFAKAIDCSESHLSLMLIGERRPSYETAKRMSAATGDEIAVDKIFEEAARLALKRRRRAA